MSSSARWARVMGETATTVSRPFRRDAGGSMESAWMLLLGGSYVVYCLVAVVPSHWTTIEVDSPKYLAGNFFDPRLPGVLTSVLYAVVPARSIHAVQLVLAMGAWWLLALGVCRYFRATLGVALAALVLGYSLMTPVVSWQWLAMTDGLSMSALVASMGCLLLIVAIRPSAVTTAWLLILPVWLVALVRPTLLLVVLPPGLAVLRWVRPFGERPAMARRVLAACGAAMVWGTWRLWALSSRAQERVWYAQNNLGRKAGYAEYARTHVAGCRPLAVSVEHIRAQTPGVIPEVLRADQCPKVYAWLTSSAASPWGWMVARPLTALHAFGSTLVHTRFEVYAQQGDALPGGWSEMLLPVGVAVRSIAGVYLLVGVVLVGVASVGLRWSRRRSGMVAISAAGAGAYLLVSWASDGIELARHMMPVTTLVPLVMLLLPLLLLFDRPGATTVADTGPATVEPFVA